jgi:hypothetical protein
MPRPKWRADRGGIAACAGPWAIVGCLPAALNFSAIQRS